MAPAKGRRERVSPVDTAWRRMDSPGNLMMIVGVMKLGAGFDLARMRRLLEDRFLSFRRFRCRVVTGAGGPWWEEVEVDLDRHLVRVALPGAGDKAELQKLAAQLASEPLDPARPLWQMHVIEPYEGGAALIARIHHCIADGIALIGVLLSLTSRSAADDGAPVPTEEPLPEEGAGPWDAWLKPLTAAAVKAIDAGGDFAQRALRAYRRVLDDPDLAGQAAVRTTEAALQLAKDAATLALMQNDTVTSLKGKPSGSKVVAWCEPLALDDVKAVGKALGCSVNDVLLSCAAGAIGGYLRSRGERIDGAELRAMVPVNLRREGDRHSLGNKFGLVPVLLPIGIEHPVARVLEVRRRMAELKGGYMPLLAMAILGVVGLVPRALQKRVLDLFGRKTTAVMTNVPGPRELLYLAGAPVEQIMFWVPQTGDVAVGVSILSYHGGVQFGLVTDKAVCGEPQRIIDRFAPEFENLVYALLLAPWDEALEPELARETLAATETAAGVAARLKRAKAGGDGAEPGTAKATQRPGRVKAGAKDAPVRQALAAG